MAVSRGPAGNGGTFHLGMYVIPLEKEPFSSTIREYHSPIICGK